jgi:DegV family protein with EDD domain
VNRFAIVTDGTCTLPGSFFQENDVQLIPLHVIFGADDYVSGVTLSHQQFYEMLASRREHPTTSAPSLGDCHEVFERVLATGTRDVLVITMDGNPKRSATHSIVKSAAQAMTGNFVVVDSKSVSGGLGFIVSACARARREGRSFQETVDLAQRLSGQSVLLVYVDTLEFLRRGGRVPAAQALFGSLLHIKPILRFGEGDPEPVERVRTRSRGLQRVRELALAEVGAGKRARMCVLHTKSPDDARAMADWVQQTFHCSEFFREEAGPVLAVHVGPGVVAVGYLRDEA